MNAPIDKQQFLDSTGRPITQALFLEIGYTQFAVYTLKDNDHIWNDKVYPSIKRLYLEMNDPTEYKFANTYLLGWKHWKRICENKALKGYIAEWREELELKLRCQGIIHALDSAKSGSFQAAKWIADRGWESRGAGRPSKDEIEREKKFQTRVEAESLSRLSEVNPKLAAVMIRAAEISVVPFEITEGKRSLERQKLLYEDGKSRTMHSYHLTGKAVDIVAEPDGLVSWDFALYHKINDAVQIAATELDTKVTWGGTFPHLVDGPHFQLEE